MCSEVIRGNGWSYYYCGIGKSKVGRDGNSSCCQHEESLIADLSNREPGSNDSYGTESAALPREGKRLLDCSVS
jgi:hypothetical protein